MDHKYRPLIRVSPFLPIIAIGSCALAISLPSIDSAKYFILNKVGQHYATKEFGDGRPPFIDSERKEWYASLGVDILDPDSEPTINQLDKYINSIVGSSQPAD